MAFEPDWFILEPGIALYLIDAIKENHLAVPQRLQYIELHSESAADHVQRQLIETFQVDVVNVFGMTEANGIACSCKHNRLHILEQNMIVEVVNDGKSVINEEGFICVTPLLNYAMPLIRYETGEKGILRDSDCSCGSHAQVLTITTTPPVEIFVLGNGEVVTNQLLSGIVEITNENMQSCISRYRIDQTGVNGFHVSLALKPRYKGWAQAVEEAFLANTRLPELRDIHWDFDFSENSTDFVCADAR